MQNFELYNPTKLIFGKGEISKLNQNIAKDKKVLVIYGGGSIKKNGVYEQVTKALSGYEVHEFAGVEANPEYETCLKAVEYIKENNIDFLLAVGGGSVIDATKFISAATNYEGDPWDIITKWDSFDNAVDFGVVLTMPATGSEMNCGSVISRRALNKKLAFMNAKVFPKFSILDPETTYTLPTRQITNGVVDAFVHVMEQYLTFPQDAPIHDRFAEGILSTLLEEGPKGLATPTNYEVRSNIMFSATMALNGLIGTGVIHDWSTHDIGHELTAFYGLDHAQTLAIILPNIMQYKRREKGEKIAQYAQRVLGVDKELSQERQIDIAIEKTIEFFESVGNPTKLSAYAFDGRYFDDIIKNLEDTGVSAMGEHQDIKLSDIRKILEMSL